MAQERRRAAVARTAVLEAEPSEGELTPAYAAALLKVAMELRRSGAGGIERLCAKALDGLPVDRAEFQGYLLRNFSLVQAAGRKPR